MSILNKLEIDVMQACELKQAVDFTTKYGLQAMVVHPSLVAEAIMLRITRKKHFNIITTVDWPKGELTGIKKFSGMVAESFKADGFEIYCTAVPEGHWHTEAMQITKFIREALSNTSELRFVLGTQTRDSQQIVEIVKGFNGVPTPKLLRTDHNLKSQITRANPEVHNGLMEIVKNNCSLNVKLSGNINNAKAVTSCPEASRFAVNYNQAMNIMQELEKQPEQLRTMLR